MKFNVRPRYTPGSPSLVDEATALAVAEDERRAYERHLAGRYGVAAAQQAQRLGLHRIVYQMVERRGGWEVADMLTGEHYTQKFAYREGDRVEVWGEALGWQPYSVHKTSKRSEQLVVVMDLRQEAWQQTPVGVAKTVVRVPEAA